MHPLRALQWALLPAASASIPRLVSTVVRIDDVAYYIHLTPMPWNSTQPRLGTGQVAEPCTVFNFDCDNMDQELHRALERFAATDDVWSPSFLGSIIIQFPDEGSSQCKLSREMEDALRGRGAGKIYVTYVTAGAGSLSEGPYFLNNGALHQTYRLYADTASAFVVATVPVEFQHDNFQSLDASAYGEKHPLSLAVAVPSRLYHPKTAEKPFAGLRIAIKDIMDLKGLKTGASSRAYTSLYPVRSENAEAVQRLVDLGFVVVGKVKTTQLADSEWPTCDWVDYHGAFNPRGDGYLTTSGSSAGSAAAIASYPWLDFSLGTDTLGSIRSPAAAQGIFGMRSSLDAASFKGVIPYSPKFDTIGGFARTAAEYRILAQALYGSPQQATALNEKPTKLLYPTEYWPVHHKASQVVFDEFITRLEKFLGLMRTPISFEELWNQTRPDNITESLTNYLEHAFEWAANPDQWSGFFKDFIEDYETEMGKLPVLNPQLRFKQNYLPTLTADQQAEAVKRLNVYREWFYANVMPASRNGHSETLIVLPWTNGEPDYRDTYRTGPQQFTGIGFFFYNIGPYAEAPEIIVPGRHTPLFIRALGWRTIRNTNGKPVTPTTYKSKYTGLTEDLPAAVGLVGAKGSDIMLAELVYRLLEDDVVENGEVPLDSAGPADQAPRCGGTRRDL